MKNAMVWGASGGIGRAIVEELVRADWQVVAFSRINEELDTVATHSFYVDVSVPVSVQQAVQAAAFEVTEIDLLIYAVGDIASVTVEAMKPDVWNRILSANLSGAFLVTHFSLPLLAADAHIVFVGAISERLHLPGLSAYAAAKAGIEAYADSLRKEQRGRRVTVVRPAAVDTPLWDRVPSRVPKGASSPHAVAGRILAAYEENHSGTLDLA